MNLLSHIPVLVIVIPLLAAFASSIIGKLNKKYLGLFVSTVLGINLIMTLILAINVLTKGPAVYVFGGSDISLTHPSGFFAPIRIIFQIDAMSIFMGLIASVVFFLASVYSLSYMKKHTGLDKYYTLLLLLSV